MAVRIRVSGCAYLARQNRNDKQEFNGMQNILQMK